MYVSFNKAALTMVVRWEISALRRTGGYSVLENNLYKEGVSGTDGPGKDKPDAEQSLEESSYKYVPPFRDWFLGDSVPTTPPLDDSILFALPSHLPRQLNKSLRVSPRSSTLLKLATSHMNANSALATKSLWHMGRSTKSQSVWNAESRLKAKTNKMSLWIVQVPIQGFHVR